MGGIRHIGMMALLLAVPACGTVDLFGSYDLPESEDVAEAPWPRLADVPEAPPPGSYSNQVPDPAKGFAILTDLGAAANSSGERATTLAAPVLSDRDRRRLGR
ncbi:MAG: hypothetical protein AAF415_18455 [Pseudomonadota bacterium]